MADHRILVINPNSNQTMTDTLKPILDSFKFEGITYDLFTAPDGPNSINNEEDAAESERHCLPALEAVGERYSGFLVGCYSAHPLVPTLARKYPGKHVLGIFEASVVAALALCGQARNHHPSLTWGIVTTGKAWEPLLTHATSTFLGLGSNAGEGGVLLPGRFAGVQSTGFNADELHDAPKDLVRERLTQATRRLLDAGSGQEEKEKLRVVALGCAGMAELEAVVREVVPPDVKIVDGVKAGYCQLASMIMSGT